MERPLARQSYWARYNYLWHRIIDSFPWILKGKIIRLKQVLFVPRGRRTGLTKLVLIFFFILIAGSIPAEIHRFRSYAGKYL